MSERQLELDIRIAATPDQVWDCWTTDAGARTFFAPDSRIEAEAGGAYELYFDPEQPEGYRGSEGCTVIELQVRRRLAFSWTFPPHLSIRGETTRVDIHVSPEDDGTRVRLVHSGFQRGGDWDAGFTYFENAWRLVLARLQHRFIKGPLDWSDPYVPDAP